MLLSIPKKIFQAGFILGLGVGVITGIVGTHFVCDSCEKRCLLCTKRLIKSIK